MNDDELSGPELDAAVARLAGLRPKIVNGQCYVGVDANGDLMGDRDFDPSPTMNGVVYSSTTNWAIGGPLIEKHCISIEHSKTSVEWAADIKLDCLDFRFGSGPTPLVAAMRALVAKGEPSSPDCWRGET